MSEKCEVDELYGDEYDFQNIALFEKYSVSVIVTAADGESLIKSNVDPKILSEQLNYTLLANDNNSEAIEATGDYKIFEQKLPGVEDAYIILLGVLPDGNIVFIRSNSSALMQVAAFTNRFLLYIVIVGSLISIIIGKFVIAYFTRPLFELINITKRISNFDFDATYHPQKFYNEMDDLGEHVNEMSTTLKRAIEQLRTANESLKHDLELREETENMRKEFVSNVSHELKTPIALIQGYAEGLQEGIMDDEISRQIYLDIIIDEANKMNRLVREMLILNQLEAGQMSMDMVDFDLTEMIDSVVESNKINFEAQGISYSFINKTECYVHADEFLVEQVVTNFISNAIHYVLNENILNVRYDFLKKGKVRISVFNSGNNIAKKDLKHIWEKFYKADKARSREYGGSGIGLSVVKATMELLHEKFGVENLPNGVEFWFELSLAKDTKIKENS
ncbi:Signal transduction histidine kinase [Pseudobutyrivibrio sp. YE44]|uniref:sensor histidine kinase n=1 Tax=Pseudobutyrivibrio sp. YE44 TaxID=1520802 RepID=UPI00088F822F|nr:HAMP domain-containing sensor histidine kinase [Pseudobutyrivibrio sp. YE44]SDB08400.1 Signal transduction histidine kinase [Pseudobutyrivibrio sp. YE44]